MVVIHVKQSDADSFLYETTCSTSNDEMIRDVVEVWNLRIRLLQLCGAIIELAKYGPMKQPDKAGLDEVLLIQYFIMYRNNIFFKVEEKYNGNKIDRGEFYLPDPTGARCGSGVGPQLSDTIERVAQDAMDVLSKLTVDRKISLSRRLLQEKLDNIRGAVTMGKKTIMHICCTNLYIAYPMGLPEWDTVRLTIEGVEGLDGTSAGQQILDPNTAELWVASKAFDRSQTVADRLGRNEKTKVIAKLQKPGAGAPGREPGVSEDEKKAMMAYYFKKQEEMKKLAENSEDDYLHSSWADSKSLQRSLRGQSDIIKAPGILR